MTRHWRAMESGHAAMRDLQRRWKLSPSLAAIETTPRIYMLPATRNANCNDVTTRLPVRYPDIRDSGVVKPMCRSKVLPMISSTNVGDDDEADAEFENTDNKEEKAADTAASFSPLKCNLTSTPARRSV